MKIYEILNDKENFNFACIYLWTNLLNGKVYVGQTQNFYNRMKQYYKKREHRLINFALDKYGFDNFDVIVLNRVESTEVLDDLEQYWMDFYKSYERNIGYNVCREASTTRGYHHTEHDKKKMSEIAKRCFQENPSLIKKGKDNHMFGKKLSEETKKKMSKSRKGNQNVKGKSWKLSKEFCENRSKRMKGNKNCLGRKLSEGTKRKISEGNKGKIVSKETREKISKANRGKTSKKVKCVELDRIFDSILSAAEFIEKDHKGISSCLHGK